MNRVGGAYRHLLAGIALASMAACGRTSSGGPPEPRSTPAPSDMPAPTATATLARATVVVGPESLVTPPGFVQGGYAIAARGDGSVALVAGGPRDQPTEIYSLVIGDGGAVGPPTSLQVRRPDPVDESAAIHAPRLVFARTGSFVFWRETDCVTYGGFGCQESTWGRTIDAPAGEAREILAGPVPIGACRSGLYGDLSVAPGASDDLVGFWRRALLCFGGAGDVRGFRMVSSRFDLSSPPIEPEEAAPRDLVAPPSEPISDAALASGPDGTLGVWWERRYETGGAVVDSIEASLEVAPAARNRIADAHSGSRYDPACNLVTDGCFHPADTTAPPAATRHDDGFLVAWVADPHPGAPEDVRATTQVQAMLIGANGALGEGASATLIADGTTPKAQPLAASNGAATLLVWLDADLEGTGSTVWGVALSSAGPLIVGDPSALASNVVSAALTRAGDGFVLLAERGSSDERALYAIPISVRANEL
jgi:hypothetical protein